jgi:hypothetical protein
MIAWSSIARLAFNQFVGMYARSLDGADIPGGPFRLRPDSLRGLSTYLRCRTVMAKLFPMDNGIPDRNMLVGVGSRYMYESVLYV